MLSGVTIIRAGMILFRPDLLETAWLSIELVVLCWHCGDLARPSTRVVSARRLLETQHKDRRFQTLSLYIARQERHPTTIAHSTLLVDVLVDAP